MLPLKKQDGQVFTLTKGLREHFPQHWEEALHWESLGTSGAVATTVVREGGKVGDRCSGAAQDCPQMNKAGEANPGSATWLVHVIFNSTYYFSKVEWFIKI